MLLLLLLLIFVVYKFKFSESERKRARKFQRKEVRTKWSVEQNKNILTNNCAIRQQFQAGKLLFFFGIRLMAGKR